MRLPSRFISVGPIWRRCSENEVFVDIKQFLEKFFFAQNPVCQKGHRNAAGHVFHCLAAIPTLNSVIIAMSFGVRLLQQRKPCLIRICAFGEIQCFRACLVAFLVFPLLFACGVVIIAPCVKVFVAGFISDHITTEQVQEHLPHVEIVVNNC